MREVSEGEQELFTFAFVAFPPITWRLARLVFQPFYDSHGGSQVNECSGTNQSRFALYLIDRTIRPGTSVLRALYSSIRTLFSTFSSFIHFLLMALIMPRMLIQLTTTAGEFD